MRPKKTAEYWLTYVFFSIFLCYCANVYHACCWLAAWFVGWFVFLFFSAHLVSFFLFWCACHVFKVYCDAAVAATANMPFLSWCIHNSLNQNNWHARLQKHIFCVFFFASYPHFSVFLCIDFSFVFLYKWIRYFL